MTLQIQTIESLDRRRPSSGVSSFQTRREAPSKKVGLRFGATDRRALDERLKLRVDFIYDNSVIIWSFAMAEGAY